MRNATVVVAAAVVVMFAVTAPAYGSFHWVATGDPASWHDAGSWRTGEGVPDGSSAVYIKEPDVAGPAATCLIGADIATSNLAVGYSTDANCNGTVIMSAGNLGGSGTVLAIGNQQFTDRTMSSFTQTGGTVSGDIGVGIQAFMSYLKGSGNGIYTISGGSIAQGSDKYVIVGRSGGSDGDMRFKVDNSGLTGPSITVGSYTQYASTGTPTTEATLQMILNGTTGNAATINVTGDATLAGTLGISGYEELNKVVTVLTAGGTLNYESLTLNTASAVSWDIITSGANYEMGKIKAICTVPEPATLTLLGIGGIGVLLRRKRR